MALSATGQDAYVRQWAPTISRDIHSALLKAHDEADLVAEVEKAIDRFGHGVDFTMLHLERERTLINGRADAVYNRLVIEYEPPNSLRASNTHRNNQHAIDQVKQYMEGLERLDRHRKERLAGVVLDGKYYIFVRYRDDHWRIDDPVKVDTHTTETFLRYLLSLATELALTPGNLVRDFGENSNTARHVVPVLYDALRSTQNPKVEVLFNQWQRQFREVSGYDPAGVQLSASEVARPYAVKGSSIDLEKLFFAIHTYYATFIKLLALQVAHYYLMPRIGTGLTAIADYPTEELRAYLADMEHGGVFAELGIRNFLEGDFFGWYLDIWDEPLDTATRRLITDLGNYSLITLDVDPEETRDLLKHLYQNLMPKKLRHALGEYYTPDWLAERLLNQLGYDGDPSRRILDPACGSGTFLVLAIKRLKQYADEKALAEVDVLDQVLRNVVGFDLNPLAVISARTNYLLALGDLLPHRKSEISIPIYLADSILTPTKGGNLFTSSGFSFSTAVGRFTVPSSLVDARYIDPFADLLEDCVHTNTGIEKFKARLTASLPIDVATNDAEINVAVTLYEQLLDLERRGINGIWARIIKNAFAPLFQGHFDFVAGNPPWVNWESLPAEYRQESIPLWHYHGMIPPGGLKSVLGHSKMDISALMLYVSAENYLRLGGLLGFVITQSVLKTGGAGETFRRFVLGNGTRLKVLAVDDMVVLQPFEGASNRTAVIIMQSGRPTTYPVSYNLWKRVAVRQRIPQDASLSEAISMCAVRQFVAQPVDNSDLRSTWLTGTRRALDALRRVLGTSDYQAHVGAYTGGANAVYWMETITHRSDGLVVVRNLTEGAKRQVDSVQAVIEPELIYPLLRANDVKRWFARPSAEILVPRRENYQEKSVPEQVMQESYPKTYAYLSRFRDVLAMRRDAVLMRSKDSVPFYSIGAVSGYTFAPYKVVWPNIGSQIDAAVLEMIDSKPIIPQHILTLIACQDSAEAHYICAVVNSQPFDFAVQSSSQRGGKSFGTPGVLKNVRIPRYDATNPLHIHLAALSAQAHLAAGEGDADRLLQIETEIDNSAAQVWGLTEDELREIQESLAELIGVFKTQIE